MTALDLDTIAASIRLPDAYASDSAKLRQDRLIKPTGALGRLEDISAWLASTQGVCPTRPLSKPVVVIFASDHGAARTAGTSAYPPEVTAQMVLGFASGRAAVNVLAGSRGAEVRVFDLGVDTDWDDLPGGDTIDPTVVSHKVRRGTGSIDVEDAMSREECEQAISAGMAIADEVIDAGADILIAGDMGIGNTTPAAALVGLLCNLDASVVVGRGTGIDDATWMRKAGVVRDAMRRARPHKGDHVALLATAGGPDIAAMVGFMLQAARRGVPLVLDGVISCTAALVAHRIAFRAKEWWIASHRSTEPAQAKALERLEMQPVIDLGMRLGEGTGALAALPLITAAADLLAGMATFEEAGVSGP